MLKSKICRESSRNDSFGELMAEYILALNGLVYVSAMMFAA